MDKNKSKDSYKEEVHPVKGAYLVFYIIVFVMILAMGLYYLNNIDKTFANKIVPASADKPKIETDLPLLEGKVVPGIDLATVGNPTDELLAKGKEKFLGTCAACHGETGNGDGPGGAALTPKPRNFHSKDGWTNGRDLVGMYKTLTEGIPNTGMAAYEFFSIEERFALIHYIRTFENDFPPINSDDLAQLDMMYSISQGSSTPPQIPTKVAIEKLSMESAPEVEKVNEVMKKIENSPEIQKILDNVSRNKFKALYTISELKKQNIGKDKFLEALYGTIPQNGFNSKVLKLDNADRDLIYGITNYF